MSENEFSCDQHGKRPRIYFAAAVASTISQIDGGSERMAREKDMWRTQLYPHLKAKGEITNTDLWEDVLMKASEGDTPPKEVYDYSITDGVLKSTHVVAEVSRLSHGVGIEIGIAIANQRRVLCLYRAFNSGPEDKQALYDPPDRLSRMVKGAPVTIVEYASVQEARDTIDRFFSAAQN